MKGRPKETEKRRKPLTELLADANKKRKKKATEPKKPKEKKPKRAARKKKCPYCGEEGHTVQECLYTGGRTGNCPFGGFPRA